MDGYNGPDRRSCHQGGCRVIDEIAKKAGREAANYTFAILGVDLNNPEQVKKLQETIWFAEKINKNMGRSMIGFFTALGAIIAAYFLAKFGIGK